MKEPRNKRNSGTDQPMPGVDFRQLETLLDFMASHGLEEFEYERGGLRIRLKKASPSASGMRRAGAVQHAVAAAAELQAEPHQPGPVAVPSPVAGNEELHIIKSPIVGTFYAAASPGAAQFVKIGDMIQPGQVVCIIEAMKLMNEIEADVSGELVRTLVENGQPVEYGQGLFAIRPAKKK